MKKEKKKSINWHFERIKEIEDTIKLLEKTNKYIKSSKGRDAIKNALEKADKEIAGFKKARELSYTILHEPMTI